MATKAWSCNNCSAPNGSEDLYCPVCMYGRPLDKKGIPQIFSGLVFHFNGIIPRTLKHPSHSVEWRMAERHGATVDLNFDPNIVTALIYRPGYERSDKVKQAVEQFSAKVNCVPVNWMLDSLLQSRQIHPALYRLRAIPAVAQPTVKGNNLPHHQHPYFVLNCDEYTLFPLPKDQPQQPVLRAAKEIDVEQPPKSRDIPPIQWGRVDIWEAAAATTTSGKDTAATATAHNDDFDETNDRASRGIDLLKGAHNRCNPSLFSGIVFALSESLQSDANVVKTITHFGGTVAAIALDPNETTSSLEDSNVTHVLFHHDDKKKEFMISAAGVTRPLHFCDALWAEDCLMLDELIPAEEPYIASSKLMATLAKKRAKR